MGSRLAFAMGSVHRHTPINGLHVHRHHSPVHRLTMSARGAGPEVLCLDCTGTIMRVKGSMPRLYLGVLEDRLGVQEGGLPDKVSESDLLDSFKTSLKQRSKELPCFGAGVMSSEDWWEEVVRATFRGAGVSDKTLGIDEGGSGGGGGGNGGVFGDVFDRLFHDVFTSTTAWELVPGAEDVLEDLRAWCQEDGGPLAIGAMSNFDERLHPLLKNLGVYDSFDFVLTSRECGSEKPDPGMFLEAAKRVGAAGGGGGGRGVLVGDTFRTDVLGARSVGWDAVLITRGKGPAGDEEREIEHSRVDHLMAVPAALGIVGKR